MPPSTASAAMFHRGGNYLHRRLTKLYSDTKHSYASNVTPASTPVSEDPDVRDVRRDFQIQHDRLLAWGYHWTDTKAAEAQYHGYDDVEIDKRLDQAGFGDLVAKIMSEIQKLLDESGRLQHPERYLAGKGSKLPQSPQQVKKEWTEHEVTTARALLDQLITRIDTLYGLSETRRTISQSEKWDTKLSSEDQPATSSRKSMEDLEENFQSRKRQRVEDEKSLPQEPIQEDSLFIDFKRLVFQPESTHDSVDPPPYEELNSTASELLLGTLEPDQPVIVDFVTSKQATQYVGASLNLKHLHDLADLTGRLSHSSGLSHNAHLKLLGFTVDKLQHRIGFVYAMRNKVGITQRPRQLTLAAIIRSGYTSTDPSSPNLENRFRLAYNIVMSVLGYLTAGSYHSQLNSGSIVYDVGSGRSSAFRDWRGIRTPMLLPSAQSAITAPVDEPHTAQIFRHPSDDPKYDTEIAPSQNIYSLGLVLLEIGLWMPLAKLWKQKYNRTTFMAKVKTVYVRNLSSKCSSKYMRAVEKCLDAPHKDLSPSASLWGRNGMLDPGHYLLDIARDLAQCCAIDDEGPPPTSDFEHFVTILNEKALKDLEEEEFASVQAPLTPNSMPDEETSLEHNTATKSVINSEAGPEANGVLRKWPEIDIAQDDLDQWNAVLMPKLSKLLQNALERSSESCSVSLMMVGPNPETARTTICIQCDDTATVHNALRRRFRPKRGWGVVILKGEIKRSGRRRTPKRSQKQSLEYTALSSEKLREQFYQEKPSCGASIGAFKDGEHLPPVSFGGTIIVDGQPFGMTVHHMLDEVSDDEDEGCARRSGASRDTASLQLQTLHGDIVFMQPDQEIALREIASLELSDEECSDSDSDTSTIRPDYSAFDADGNEFWFLEDAPESEPGLDDYDGSDSESSGSDHEDDDTASIGDRDGVDPTDEDTFRITQPAIDDVDEDFFPNPEDRNEDHLDSHSFGYLHASSGIKRVVSGNVKHEVDWALIKIQEERLHVGNAIRSDVSARRRRRTRSSKFRIVNDRDPMLTGIMSSQKLSGTEVHCCGRSSGFKKGRISQAMALVKLHGRQSFSSSWCVEGGFGIPGDSGAWVYDPANRQLCGHVLAWGDKSKTAYIAPMEVLFEDIKETLGAESVCLPGSEELGVEGAAEKELNQQLQNSRDIEVALGQMALNDGDSRSRAGSKAIAPPRGKNVATIRQRSMGSQSQTVVQVVL